MNIASEKTKAKVLLQKRKITEAIRLLNLVCKENNDAEAYYMLGQAYAFDQSYSKAKDALIESIRIYPAAPWSYYALGGLYKAEGNTELAIKNFNKVLEFDQNIIDAEIAIASAYITQGEIQRAKSILNKLLQKDSSKSAIYYELSRIEKEFNNLEESETLLSKALDKEPSSIPALSALAALKTVQAKISEAENLYKNALTISPNNIDLLSGLAKTYSYDGKYDKAISLIEPFIEKKIKSFDLAKAYLSIANKTNKHEQAIQYAKEIIEGTALTKNNISYIHFEIGKHYDDLNKFDIAFEHYKKANLIAKKYYDENANIRKVSEIINFFNKDKIKNLSKAKNKDKQPVFIIGMPRSGTSLTEQILASHPDVVAAGELQNIGKMSFHLKESIRSDKTYPYCIEDCKQEDKNRLANDYLKHLTTLSTTAKRITNKMPRDFYDLGLIYLLFPGAKVIHCKRNPIDNCLSIYFQNFGERGNEYANDLKMIAGYYNQYQRLMNHWYDVLDISIYNINYEDLVSNQREITRDLLEFCELDWNEECLAFHKLDRTIATASFDQVRQPLYKKSVNRWKNYEPYLDVLKERLDI